MVSPPGGTARPIVAPSGWLAEVWEARSEMGRDVNGYPLATERFAVIGDARLDAGAAAVVRRLWRAADRGQAAASAARHKKLEEETSSHRQHGRRR